MSEQGTAPHLYMGSERKEGCGDGGKPTRRDLPVRRALDGWGWNERRPLHMHAHVLSSFRGICIMNMTLNSTPPSFHTDTTSSVAGGDGVVRMHRFAEEPREALAMPQQPHIMAPGKFGLERTTRSQSTRHLLKNCTRRRHPNHTSLNTKTCISCICCSGH